MAYSPAERAEIQKRTLNVVRCGVVPSQAATAAVVAVSTLLARDLLGGNERLAGMGSAAFTLGTAAISIPLAAYMRRNGRRLGLRNALLVGAVGTLIAAFGGHIGSFPIFIIGMIAFGGTSAANLQARYVGADLASESDKASAISAVVWLGTLGAAFGPTLTPAANRLGKSLGLADYIGSLIFACALSLVAAAVYEFLLRPDPLAVSGGLDPNAERRRPLAQVRESVGHIRVSKLASLGLFAMAASQGAMAAVMTMTPPHMGDHNHEEMSAFVIAFHIVGMYGFAPLFGRLVERVGAPKSIVAGGAVLAAGCYIAIAGGYVASLVFAGLFLVGIGWNICVIAGATLLTTCVPEDARVEAQGTGDLALSVCGALGALGSGFVKQQASYAVLAHLGAAVAIAVSLAALSLLVSETDKLPAQ